MREHMHMSTILQTANILVLTEESVISSCVFSNSIQDKINYFFRCERCTGFRYVGALESLSSLGVRHAN